MEFLNTSASLRDIWFNPKTNTAIPEIAVDNLCFMVASLGQLKSDQILNKDSFYGGDEG